MLFNKPKRSWLTKDIIGFSLASFFNDFSHEMTTAILPRFTEILVGAERAPAALGMITGIANATASAIKIVTGWWSDRISHHKFLLIAGYAVTPIFGGLMGTVQYLWQLITYRTLSWTGRGLREPARDLWLAKIVDKQDYGKTFGFQRVFDTLGAIIGPLIVFFIIGHVELRTIFFISIIPGIFSVLSIIFFTQEKIESTPRYTRKPFFEQFKALPFSFNYFLMTRLIFGLGDFNKTLIILRAQDLLSGELHSATLGTSMAIILYCVFNIIRALSEYSIGFASDYIDRKNLLAVFGFGLFGITCLMLMLASTTMWWWAFIFITAAISTAAVTTLDKAYAADLLPEQIRGTGYGLLEAASGIGTLMSSIIVGNIWTSVAAFYGFAFSAVLSVVAMVFLLIKRGG